MASVYMSHCGYRLLPAFSGRPQKQIRQCGEHGASGYLGWLVDTGAATPEGSSLPSPTSTPSPGACTDGETAGEGGTRSRAAVHARSRSDALSPPGEPLGAEKGGVKRLA
eukprot:COSAG01_NODE_12466_length_1734_cov_1.458716_3_plen_110_part_00